MDTQLLLRHGDFVRAVVRDLVRDEHQADDVVQETFLVALRNPPRDRSKWRGWLARVGRNQALTIHRRDARRRRREAAASRPERLPSTERLARSREVVDAVMALDEPERTAIVERFFEGLKTSDIAARHGVSAVTVRTRLRRGLDRVRRRFADAHGPRWSALFLPLALPAPTAAAAGALVATGGIAMKGMLIGIAVVAGVFVAFAVSRDEDPKADRAPRPAAAALEAEHARLLEEKAALLQRIDELERRHARLAEEAAAEKAGAAARDGSPAAGAETHGIDWSRIEDLIRKNQMVFARMIQLRAAGKGDEALLPSEQAALQELVLEWNKAASLARQVTPYPMADARFLPHVLNSLLSSLGLSDAQRQRVAAETVAVLEAHPSSADATPLVAYQHRQKVLRAAEARFVAILDGTQRQAWEHITPLWNELREGNHRSVRLGLRTPATRAKLVSEFNAFYDLAPAQLDRAVDGYLKEAREVLRRHGRLGDGLPPLDAAARARLEADFRALQRSVEKELLPHVASERRAQLPYRVPLLVTFEDSMSTSTWHADDRGF